MNYSLHVDIPIFVPELPSTDELLPYLKEIEANKIYSNFGPIVFKLQLELANYFGVDPNHVTTLANATLALEGAIQTSSTQDSNWISPSWTFVATNLALERCCVNYSFEDVDENWRLKTQSTTSSILDVCPFGDGVDLERLPDSKLPLLIDAAASFPALKDIGDLILKEKRPVGIVVSFHPTKIVPGMEGGVFISNDLEWVQQVKSWSSFGYDVDTRSTRRLGTNAKMSEVQAAVVIASIRKFASLQHRWRSLQDTAKQISDELGLKVHPAMKRGNLSTYWIVETESELIDVIERNAALWKIQTRRWWGFACHEMPFFKLNNKMELPQTTQIAESTIGLPFFFGMTSSNFDHIYKFIDQVNQGKF